MKLNWGSFHPVAHRIISHLCTLLSLLISWEQLPGVTEWENKQDDRFQKSSVWCHIYIYIAESRQSWVRELASLHSYSICCFLLFWYYNFINCLMKLKSSTDWNHQQIDFKSICFILRYYWFVSVCCPILKHTYLLNPQIISHKS